MLPLLHAQVPSTTAKGAALVAQYACKWISQPVICATGSPQEATSQVPTAAQAGGISVKMKISPAMLIHQPAPCGLLPMSCRQAVIQCCCEQMIACAYSAIQQRHHARDNMLQSLLSQPLARNQILLQLTRILVINPCNISTVFLYFVLVAQQ